MGLSERDINDFIARNGVAEIPNPPLPLADGSLKLVNDPAHPFIAAGPNDIRGPCPALNTLASHGYLPRNGVARPDQIVTAVMEGLNLGNDFAKFLAYQAFLMNGNPITNLMSIGMKTPLTGPDPPKPALVGGLSQHGTFEGDTSMTRVDAFFGDQALFNEDLFQGFISTSAQFGFNGTYDVNAAAELRFQRLQNSIQTNPQLVFTSPRIISAYSEAVFPTIFFVDGRLNNGQLTIDAARHFFDFQMMPDDFHRQPAPVNFTMVDPLTKAIFDKHPFSPGVNHGKNNFVLQPQTPPLADFCGIYEDIVLRVIPGQYPRPTGILRENINKNLGFFFGAVHAEHNCTQVFPFGRD
ncbi:hypothetical protein M422DRAFT_226599 [Sphaerobolus stellatus SS14]|uniref:Heme haloperoxidase family profile domain-containing protein n=2 Tax=Sphaerobolus stellatus (strain SS14) TaxID=990650 RepID=A0A0C9VIS7_SPHS4|nr:hypothetical protein M422DRAFT_229630 [Sphaerobolus stellatus SS14]KIJ46614.1 hypothetical protein M422DRAFT_226596 [Sphaerobolus stellatus SS14]KIJ46615.1 hypothetical protein M422DRAFT_226599 [Sphaerobolus stellatus SS14]